MINFLIGFFTCATIGCALFVYVKIAEAKAKAKRMYAQTHFLKTEMEYWQAIKRGEKTFEVRKNDRNFKLHDIVYLQETVCGIYTGMELPPKEIVYILYGGVFGIDKDYCVFQLK